jgi:hypothetical protein
MNERVCLREINARKERINDQPAWEWDGPEWTTGWKEILFANEHGVCDQNAEPKIGKHNVIDGF